MTKSRYPLTRELYGLIASGPGCAYRLPCLLICAFGVLVAYLDVGVVREQEGYDTNVGEKSALLSGGQKQVRPLVEVHTFYVVHRCL